MVISNAYKHLFRGMKIMLYKILKIYFKIALKYPIYYTAHLYNTTN